MTCVQFGEIMDNRATSNTDKERKYEMILATTLELYKRDRCLHTAAQISQEAGIAKGTLYLYFHTKEEIYMELLWRNFRRWHEALRDYVLDQPPNADALVEYMCRSLSDFTDFVDLITVASVVLEEHLSLEYLRAARLKKRQETERTCKLMARTYPQWNLGFCLQNMKRFYAYGIGYWRECLPSSRVIEAMPEEFADIEGQRSKYFSEILIMNRLIWGLT